MMWEPDQTRTGLPSGENTMRQPSPLVAVVPSRLGVEPTITQPVFSMAIEVVSPTPPGHCDIAWGSLANSIVCLVEGR